MDIILLYRTTPPYTPGEYLPRVTIDGAGRQFVFPSRAYVDCIAERRMSDDAPEYLLHVTVTNYARPDH